MVSTVAHVKKVLDKNPPKSVGTSVEMMLKSGRLATETGLDLQEVWLVTYQLACVLVVIMIHPSVIHLYAFIHLSGFPN